MSKGQPTKASGKDPARVRSNNLLDGSVVFRAGLATGVACAPKNMRATDVEVVVNREYPTGIKSRWRCVKKVLEDGTKTPCACLEDVSRRHHWMEC